MSKIGTPCLIIGTGGFEDRTIRFMLRKALNYKKTSDFEDGILERLKQKKKLNQNDRTEIRRIYLKNKPRGRR